MYKVYCNDKPADETGFPELVGCRYGDWPLARNTHQTLEDARRYLTIWLGMDIMGAHVLKPNQTITLVSTQYTIKEIES